MTEPNPDSWAQLHMQRLALSRWESEGGSFFSRRALGGSRHHVARTVPAPDAPTVALVHSAERSPVAALP